MFPITTLASAATATTNPVPTSLSPATPYPTPFTGYLDVSSAWTSAGVKAFFPNGAKNNAGQKPLPIWFIPSAGTAVTYDVTIWFYDKDAGKWITPANNGTKSLTGQVLDFVENVPNMPMYLQFANISSGNILVKVDETFGKAL